MSTSGGSAVERTGRNTSFRPTCRVRHFRASARTLVVSREARDEGELPDGLEDANTATSSDPPATGQGPDDRFRPNSAVRLRRTASARATIAFLASDRPDARRAGDDYGDVSLVWIGLLLRQANWYSSTTRASTLGTKPAPDPDVKPGGKPGQWRRLKTRPLGGWSSVAAAPFVADVAG